MRVLLIALTLVAVVAVAAVIGAACTQHAPDQPWWICLFYAEVREWQTFLAAGLGFAGLIWVARQGYAGILLSTKHADSLAKRAAELALERDEKRRSYELQALARALAAEVASFHSNARRIKDSLTDDIEAGEAIPTKMIDRMMKVGPFSATIYPANARLIGQLGQDLAEQIVYFHGNMVPITDTLRLIGQLPGTALSKKYADIVLEKLDRIVTLALECTTRLNNFADDLDKTRTPPTSTASGGGAPTGYPVSKVTRGAAR